MSTLRNDSTPPPSIERLIENGQPQFGVFAQVNTINFLDYYSHLISQKELSNWRKDLKANQFCFIQIIEAPYRICFALATIKIATSAFVYVFNDDNGEMEVCEALRPLTNQSSFEGDHHRGLMQFTHSKLTLSLDFAPEKISVVLDSQYLALNAKLERHAQPLAVCSPTGRRGWTFTQKEPLTSLDGEILIKSHSKFNANDEAKRIELSKSSIANLDWTLGYMRHETNWFWTCINHILPDNRHFFLNLSMGVNETGTSENACWLDGQIYHLPSVLFDRQDVDTSDRNVWRIYHQNLGWSNIDIDLTFTPIKVYKKTDNFGVVASIFEQWLGEYSGEIRLGEHVIQLDKVLGLAEDHFAKW